MEPDFSEIFEPHFVERLAKIKEKDIQFSHYTSAEVAVSVIKKKEIWLRNAAVMNDYNEITYGINLAIGVLGEHGDNRFNELLQELNSESPYGSRFHFVPTLPHDVYLLCLSEHGSENGAPSECDLGRLSMWRAYGGNTNVAMVFRREALLAALAENAIVRPVLYAGKDEFAQIFSSLLDAMQANIGILKRDSAKAVGALQAALYESTLKTKSLGFAEEQEWRVIYRDGHAAEKLPCEVFSVGGVPQKVHLLKLDGSKGLHLNDLLDHILIGPTPFPKVIKESLIEVLGSNGVSDPTKRVKVSNIPLRR